MSHRYKVGDILDVDVAKIIPNGLGLCFVENLTVFVPLSAKGDRLRVVLVQIKQKTAFARIESIFEPSPDRTEPPCKYFGECGGCDFQQMTYDAQLAAKADIVADCLQRIAGIELAEQVIVEPSPRQIAYRLRTQLHADRRTQKIGFFKRQSHDVVEADECPILTPRLGNAVTELKRELRRESLPDGITNIDIAASGDDVSLFANGIFDSPDQLKIDVSDNQYVFNARTFFQANEFMADRLVETAVGGYKGKLAIDLYCGIGLFTVPLAASFETVVGVESGKVSSDFARENARAAGAANVEIENRRVREYLSDCGLERGEADLILVDPPRSGLKTSILDQIAQLEPAKISYVSCNPSTLARDLKAFLDRGYRMENIAALDLFPQTHHVECAVRLSRR